MNSASVDGLSRRIALKLMAARAAALAASRGGVAENLVPAPPNVLIVMLDDVGYSVLACLGNPS
ncbi:MAG: hypothetical protein ACYCSP_15975 [Acidobacteriaceae bacterium]